MVNDLPIDDELEAILAARDASRLDRSRRTLFGLMRALARVRARQAERREWLEAVRLEGNAAMFNDGLAETWLAESIEAIAPDFLLEGSKHVDVPGAGRVQFRDTPAGLRIAQPQTFIDALNADERALLVEQKSILRTNAAKLYADNVVQESGELLPGVERVPAQRTASITTDARRS